MLLSFLLSVLLWLFGGMIVGALVNAAHWGLAGRRPDLHQGGLRTVGVGAMSALVGGGMGRLLFGTPFGLPTALWFSGMVVFFVAWIAGRKRAPSVQG